ncbi:MAG: acyltransferase [Rhodospirillaceae bacterium]
MNKATSAYLDMLRVMTAIVVFLVHASYQRFTGGIPIIGDMKFLANDGVMVFFVLSGFVISYVCDKKEPQVTDYAISRIARLYSVSVPALILTVILDYIGSSVDFSVYDGWWFEMNNPLWRLTAALFYINELWFSSVRLFSNGPFWSLGYEFWYYVIFGAFFYFDGMKRLFIAAISALIAGPKIMLLSPVWLLGVATYRVVKCVKVSEFWGWLLFFGSVVLYALFIYYDAPLAINDWSLLNLEFIFSWKECKWSYAAPFLNCYAVGAMASLHFIGFAAISHRFLRVIGQVSRYIHYVAGFTFSIYLFHYPLLQFLTAISGEISDSTLRSFVIVLGTFAIIYPLGLVTEMKKAEVKRLIALAYNLVARSGRITIKAVQR